MTRGREIAVSETTAFFRRLLCSAWRFALHQLKEVTIGNLGFFQHDLVTAVGNLAERSAGLPVEEITPG